MPTIRTMFNGHPAYLTFSEGFKPGDLPPASRGYTETQEWAEVQMAAGLKQEQCCRCGLWKFPQELSDEVIETPAKDYSSEAVREGRTDVVLTSRQCLSCAGVSP